jgi:chitodextrinase
MMTERLRASWVLWVLVLVTAAWRPALAASVTYDHDPTTGRLTRATYSDGTIVNYHYDANGNRTDAIVTLPNDSTAPSRPSFLQATAVSQTQIDLEWGASTDNLELGGYRLERCTGADCTFSQIAELTETTRYQDTGRTSNTTYVYRVRAFDTLNNHSSYSDNATAVTPANSAPTAPGVPETTNRTMVSATVTWSAARDSDGTVVGYEYRVNAGNWIATSGTTASLTGLSAWTDYTVQVRARDNSGNWGPASTGMFTTLDSVAPSAPSGPPTISEVTMTSAKATWPNASDNGRIDRYEYSLDNGANWRAVGVADPRPITLSNMSPDTQYQFQVRARDAAGNAGPSVSTTFRTLDTVAPSVAEGLRVTSATSGTVNLAWNSASDNVGVTGYRIYRNGSFLGNSSSTTYPDNTTSGTTTYSYRVSARDRVGNESPQSTPALSVTTPDTIAPNAPTNLAAAQAGPTQINLAWTHATDDGGSGRAGYRIYRGGAPIFSTGPNANTYNDTPLTPNTTYTYTVVTLDNTGNASGHSNTASATTPLPLQAAVNSTSWSWFTQQGQPPRINPTTINVTASGGSGGGYTYAWQYVSGDTATSVNSPTSSSTQWTRTITNFFTDYVSVWRCRVTDSAGNVTFTPNVTVTLRAENLNRARHTE